MTELCIYLITNTGLKNDLIIVVFYGIFPSLTVGKNKNGHKASKIKLCSRFLFRNDMCYILVLEKFIILVSLIMLRIVDFLINS